MHPRITLSKLRYGAGGCCALLLPEKEEEKPLISSPPPRYLLVDDSSSIFFKPNVAPTLVLSENVPLKRLDNTTPHRLTPFAASERIFSAWD